MRSRLFGRFLASVAVLGLLSGASSEAAVVKAGSARATHHTGTRRATRTTGSTHPTKAGSPHRSRRAKVAVPRTRKGRIARSEEAKRSFMKQSGYPHGRPGFVVDHIRPLACGGTDAASNMQWQPVTAAKAKDRHERAGC